MNTQPSRIINVEPIEEFIYKVLIPDYTQALEEKDISFTDKNIERYKNFIKSGIWGRHTSETSGHKNIPKAIPLDLKVRVQDKDIHHVQIVKKGDNLITIKYKIEYNIGETQINECEFRPIMDHEVLTKNKWERCMIYQMPIQDEKPDSRLDDILKSLKK